MANTLSHENHDTDRREINEQIIINSSNPENKQDNYSI